MYSVDKKNYKLFYITLSKTIFMKIVDAEKFVSSRFKLNMTDGVMRIFDFHFIACMSAILLKGIRRTI